MFGASYPRLLELPLDRECVLVVAEKLVSPPHDFLPETLALLGLWAACGWPERLFFPESKPPSFRPTPRRFGLDSTFHPFVFIRGVVMIFLSLRLQLNLSRSSRSVTVVFEESDNRPSPSDNRRNCQRRRLPQPTSKAEQRRC